MSEKPPITTQGRDAAVAALAERRAHQPPQIDNSRLPAGAPMFFYCVACGHLSDTKPEEYVSAVQRLCPECRAMQDLGWLEYQSPIKGAPPA